MCHFHAARVRNESLSRRAFMATTLAMPFATGFGNSAAAMRPAGSFIIAGCRSSTEMGGDAPGERRDIFVRATEILSEHHDEFADWLIRARA